jgi:hypothetical protein
MRYVAIAASLALAISATLTVVPVANAKDKPKPLMADGKCWMNDKDTHFKWGDCPGGKSGGKKGKHH